MYTRAVCEKPFPPPPPRPLQAIMRLKLFNTLRSSGVFNILPRFFDHVVSLHLGKKKQTKKKSTFHMDSFIENFTTYHDVATGVVKSLSMA